ncbi:hypothetical protein CcaverHIS002_0200280 [Cutaneotrichosporon cavernicola]|nr:hypothetical protein CcaverHIS002_0200280 [Cutaneotrichosporon cavernicola]BEJ04216.1 hypothetical protein CcaverHIS641_0200330 [Cutaneotrichosporon cavernicola]
MAVDEPIRRVERALRSAGYELLPKKNGGSHFKWAHPDDSRSTPLSVVQHGGMVKGGNVLALQKAGVNI